MSELFPQAAPNFGDPLGLLRACHGRIESHCTTLQKLAPHIERHGVDAEAREAVARVHRYFTTAAPHHHEDEEVDLFPMLRGRDAALDELLAELMQEHAALARHWAALQPLLAAPGDLPRQSDLFAHTVVDFTHAYLSHAERENRRVLPQAAQLLSGSELSSLGVAMARRRKVNWTPVG